MARRASTSPSPQATDLAKRLATLVGRYSSQQAAADAAEISLSQLKRYLSGENEPAISALIALARDANVSLDWIATGKIGEKYKGWGDTRGELIADCPPADTAILPDHWASIPIFDHSAAAGGGRFNDEFNSHYCIAVEERWVKSVLRRSSRDLAGINVSGDSMEPTLKEGDIVIADLSFQGSLSDGMYVICIGDLLFVKRLWVRVDGLVVIRSDNPAYPEEVVNPAQTPIRIYGRVVAAVHQF